jgi:hypothetical protein
MVSAYVHWALVSQYESGSGARSLCSRRFVRVIVSACPLLSFGVPV